MLIGQYIPEALLKASLAIDPQQANNSFAMWGLLQIPGTDFAPWSVLLNRLLAAIALPTWSNLGIGLLLLAVYGILAIWIGAKSRFLTKKPLSLTPLAIQLFFLPALLEEIGFRVLWLPRPGEVLNWLQWWLWAAIGIGIFLVYHPLNALTFYPAGKPTFWHPVFLLLAGMLGLTCTIAYSLTGSLLIIALIHWLVVTGWIFGWGGMARLAGDLDPNNY